jgi:hypothetical protein
MSTAFAAFVAGSLRTERFTFVDIGCSGGIDPAWRIFGDRLRVLAFDASIDECERLTQQEDHPDIRYIGGFVGLQPDHPLAHAAAGAPFLTRNPFARTSAARTYQIQKERLASASLTEKLHHNAWSLTRLGDPEKPVIVPTVLAEHGWTDVDLLKIDIDGPDYLVLHSFEGKFDALGLLAARLEVNLCGGTGSGEHVFHNTDRFMRERGFELFGLDVRTYSMAPLPAPFAITAPAQTVSGRPVQGEAYYARDPAGLDWRDHGEAMRPEKMAKLAAIFSAWGQPDAAAELLQEYRGKLATVFKVDIGLELLAGEAQNRQQRARPYADYIADFEAGNASFYPRPGTIPPRTASRRLKAALAAFKNPDQAD